jgi:hypothetical protein
VTWRSGAARQDRDASRKALPFLDQADLIAHAEDAGQLLRNIAATRGKIMLEMEE